MWFDLVSYPGWLAAALAMGIVVGWRTYSEAPRRRWFDGWIIWGALLFLIGLSVAVVKLLPGRYGLWLEIALLMTGVYVFGCFLGGWLKNLLGAHEAGGTAARGKPDAATNRAAATTAAERQTTAEAVDRVVAEATPKAEARRLARRLRLIALPRRRRIVMRRKLKPRLDEKLLRPPKARRIVRLRRLPRRPPLSEKPRPRRIVRPQRLLRGPKSNDRLALMASPRRLQSSSRERRR